MTDEEYLERRKTGSTDSDIKLFEEARRRGDWTDDDYRFFERKKREANPLLYVQNQLEIATNEIRDLTKEITRMREVVSDMASQVLAHREWHAEIAADAKRTMDNLDDSLRGQALDRMK